MQNGKTIVIAGSTGLIGSSILKFALADPRVAEVRILVRKPQGYPHPKQREHVVSFNEDRSLTDAISGADIVFCSVGTTMQKVEGDKKAYRKIDYDIPLRLARLAKEHTVGVFSLVSSLGANPDKGNFYLRLKGEVERDVSALQLPAFRIFRPSMLLGARNENRTGERIGQWLSKALAGILPSNVKPIKGEAVAKAMLEDALSHPTESRIMHYKEMMELQ
jgi:uncharacterized protein YbjT (DUF2867 family)